MSGGWKKSSINSVLCVCVCVCVLGDGWEFWNCLVIWKVHSTVVSGMSGLLHNHKQGPGELVTQLFTYLLQVGSLRWWIGKGGPLPPVLIVTKTTSGGVMTLGLLLRLSHRNNSTDIDGWRYLCGSVRMETTKFPRPGRVILKSQTCIQVAGPCHT
jgi:hypothetical protein